MEKIKVYLRSEGCREPEVLEITEDSQIREIVVQHHHKEPGWNR